jgi:hypothetical protein
MQSNRQEKTMSKTTSVVPVNVGHLKVIEALVIGVPEGARLSAGKRRADGIWKLAPRDLTGLRIVRPDESDADIDLAVHVVTHEVFNGSLVESVEIRHVRIEVEAALDFVSPTCAGFDNSLSFV